MCIVVLGTILLKRSTNTAVYVGALLFVLLRF